MKPYIGATVLYRLPSNLDCAATITHLDDGEGDAVCLTLFPVMQSPTCRRGVLRQPHDRDVAPGFWRPLDPPRIHQLESEVDHAD
jgi:hypothetical protein